MESLTKKTGKEAHRAPGAKSIGQVELRDVAKFYGVGSAAKQVVKGCTLTIERNKLTAMVGPSGCGKSTLIRLIAGYEKPASGTITIDGKPVRGPGVDRLVVFQETALFPWLTGISCAAPVHGASIRQRSGRWRNFCSTK